jgi:mRNA interferase MazF
MRRGDIISVSLPGDYGKPRPAVVIQADRYRHLASVTVLPLTSEVLNIETCRVTIEPSQVNGLRLRSQIMVDKASSLPRFRVGSVIGRLTAHEMAAVTRSLALFFGFDSTSHSITTPR